MSDDAKQSILRATDAVRLYGVILGMRHAYDVLVANGAPLEHPAMRAVMLEIVTIDLAAVDRMQRDAENARIVRDQVRADLDFLKAEPVGHA